MLGLQSKKLKSLPDTKSVMNEPHVIIIDQESKGIKDLEYILSLTHPNMVVDASSTNIEKGLRLIQQFNPQIVFFAIYENNKDSCHILEQIIPQNFKLILLISNNHCHVRNCHLSPIDCIDKPIQEVQLIRAIEKYKTDKRNHNSQNKIIVPVGKDSILIDLEEVICLIADKSYTDIYMKDGTKEQASLYLHDCEIIINSDDFIRIHRHSIINMQYYKLIHNIKDGMVELKNGMNLSISETGKKTLNIWLKRYQ